MVGILVYLTTISVVPSFFFGFIFIYVMCSRRKEMTINMKRNRHFFVGILIFLGCCYINALIHGFLRPPNFVLLPLTIIISFGLNKKDLKYFLYLLIIEVGIGCYEQMLGISSILPSTETIDFAGEDLLYNRKAAGISSGPGSFGLKLLIGIMIVYIFGDEIKPIKKALIIGILFLGIVTTFTRTVLLIAAFLIFFHLFIKYKHFLFHTIKGNICLLFFVALILYGFYMVADTILFQLARGGDTVDVSGRDEIWKKMFAFIKENILLGNGSVRYMIPYSNGTMAHAHNSFIQLLADHGLLLAIPFLILIFSRINKFNYLFIFFLLFTSIAQYTIFWAYSAIDVFFYAFLCNRLIGVTPLCKRPIQTTFSNEHI